MRELTSLELSVVISELCGKVEGSRLRKFYDLGNGAFRFAFRGKDSAQVYCKLLQTFNLTSISESAEAATNFAMAVRKRLENTTVSSLRQHGTDRIIRMGFETEGKELVIEMFGKGNMLILSSDGIIEASYHRVEYKDRVIKPGEKYHFHEAQAGFIEEASNLASRLEVEGEKKVISQMSKLLNIGPIYLEEIIRRNGVDPRGFIKSPEEAGMLQEGAISFLNSIGNEKPRVYIKDSIPADYSLCKILRYSDLQFKEYESLNSLLDDFYSGERLSAKDLEKEAEEKEIRLSMERQKALEAEASAEADRCFAVGNKIFERMHEINNLIINVRESIKSKEQVLGVGNIKVSGVDMKTKKITVEVPD